jgi:20S proteasome alpha/beta subunit
MTIACGFVVRDGILLCADTLYTDGFTKEYRDKLFPWARKGAAVCFALAGHDAIARMAVEDCQSALSNSKLRRLSIADVIRTIRPVIKEVQREYVDTAPYEERAVKTFSLLIGVASNSDESPKLFATSDAAIKPVDGFQCIGAGQHLGRYIIEPMYNPTLAISRDEAASGWCRRPFPVCCAARHTDITSGGPRCKLRRAFGTGVSKTRSEPSAGHRRRPATTTDFRERLDKFTIYAEQIRKVWLDQAAPWRDLATQLSLLS